MGAEEFRIGIKRFLERFKYGNARCLSLNLFFSSSLIGRTKWARVFGPVRFKGFFVLVVTLNITTLSIMTFSITKSKL